MNILVTGGAGYIGSHLVKKILETTNYNVIVIDNLITGNIETIKKIQKIRPFEFYIKDLVGSERFISRLCSDRNIDIIYHFAGSLLVEESVHDPLKYYMNNVAGTINLLKIVKQNNIKNLIFSSSASVYGNGDMKPISPYGKSKQMVEEIIQDYAKSNLEFNYTILRYFNVAGASLDNTIGQTTSKATHLIKIASQVACGKIDSIKIFGTDYNTPDGTCVRDYIHVEDLVDVHLLSAKHMIENHENNIFNVGYGLGYSVQKVIDTMKKISFDFNVIISERRPGDVDFLVADIRDTTKKLNWVPKYNNLELICKTALDWERKLIDKEVN